MAWPRGFNGQVYWTRVPQGFKNSPPIFDKALNKVLGKCRQAHHKVSLLWTASFWQLQTWRLVIRPQQTYYRSYPDWATECQLKRYNCANKRSFTLSAFLKEGNGCSPRLRKRPSWTLHPPPKGGKFVDFWYQQFFVDWIPRFTEIAKLLNKATWGQEDTVAWTPEMNKAYKKL